jgi:hypothetical protein
MKPRRKRSKRMRVLHLWSWTEVSKAVPYLHSVIDSLREHWLEVLNAQHKLDRGARAAGPVKRQQIIEEETQKDERHRAQNQFDDALEELNKVDVFLLDPVKGMALVPFRKEDDLAWYVFDHFAPRGVVGWRYHNDPIEECRSLSNLPEVIEDGAVSYGAATATD